MKRIKKIVVILLMICLCSVTQGDVIFAADNNINRLSMTSNQFENMTNDELNQFIDNIKNLYDNREVNIENTYAVSDVPTGPVELAWLAAAQIAENNGYTCAAKLVECSVYNTPYIEDSSLANPGEGGIFYNKIIFSSCYNTYFSYLENLSLSFGAFEFTKNDNSDLYYALHNVNIQLSRILDLTIVNITDVFDFEYDNDYDSLFTGLVNNWAWLCQQTNVLYPISVSIQFIE